MILPPMSDTPRKKVNIVSICEANTTAAYNRIGEVKLALKSAEDQVSVIISQHQAAHYSAASELTKISTLIQDNEKEGIDTQKLEKKAADIRERIKRMEDEHSKSETLSAAKKAVEVAMEEIGLAEAAHESCKTQAALATNLKKSYEVASSHGAIEALEFETLDEAIDEYIANIPLVVSISKAMTIDKVALWQAPYVAEPEQFELKASKGKVYRYSRIPDSLRWLNRFPNTEYSSMPVGDVSAFAAEGVPFLVGVDEAPKKGADEDGSGEQQEKWMGDMKSYFHDGHAHGRQLLKKPAPSVYAPDGITSTNRSGLCYIKSEAKFYAVWNESFPVVEMVPGKIRKKDYYDRVIEEDGMVPKGVEADMSGLLEDFFGPMEKKLLEQAKEFSELEKATSPLVKRVAKAVKAAGVLDAPFESRNERVDGAAISKEVGAYWDAFVNAPWEGSLVKDVAMIKHLCERKLETPHVWSYYVKGHYGLRVRTRDHDWIVAQIYCPPASFSPKDKVSSDAVVYLRNQYGRCENLIKVGPCFINVTGREE